MNALSILIRTVFLLLLPTITVAGEPIRILILGDSLTAGYGLPAEDTLPVQLEQALKLAGHEVEVINAGISGDTSAGGLARLDWALATRPQIVMVELGANDALRGLQPEQTRKNLTAIIDRLQREKITVLLAGMRAPRNLGSDYYNKFDRLYPELAAQYRLAFYPFFLEGVATVPRYNQADGIHPNKDGVRVIAEKILPTVETLIDQLLFP